MIEPAQKYISPFTDYGFKRLFGEEPNKDLLIDFLNGLLHEEQGTIKNLTYLKNEQLGRTELDRRAIFDLYCENERGEKFIVELQKSRQNFFKDRSVFYATFPIQEQAKRDDWNFELKAVYTIGILDFVFDDDKNDSSKYRYDIKLKDTETNKVFYDKLTFIYLEMPKFNKGIDELTTHFDKWLYIIKNLNRLDRIPEKLKEKIFEKLFETAEIAKFTQAQARTYEDSLKYYRDLKNVVDTAKEEGKAEGKAEGESIGVAKGKMEGKAEGKAEGKIEIALNALKMGMSLENITKLTGLNIAEVEKIKKEHSL